MSDDLQVAIISPATRNFEFFDWVPCKAGEIKDENAEIVEIISWIISDIEELSANAALDSSMKNVDRSSLLSVRALSELYNTELNNLWYKWEENGIKPKFLDRPATRDHLQFILLQCYNRAVSEPDKLNQYQPFSPQVYGETSFELICQMLETVKISSEDTFIDLGSGVGQVVLQVAALSDAKSCYGIEKAEYPAMCASRLDASFRHWMAFYGKAYRPFTLERGDFLTTDYQERITSATVLFANNFAFGPEVDHQLKQRFANLKEGARIISSKAFCSLNFRITDRNLGDIGSIMHVSCLNPIQDAVSWTDKPFSYYVHVIDRSLLERYFSRLKNPKLKDDGQTVRRDRKGRIISDVPKQTSDQSKIATDYANPTKQVISKRYSICRTIRQLPKRSSSLPNTNLNNNLRSRFSNGFTVVTSSKKNYSNLELDQNHVDNSNEQQKQQQQQQHTTSIVRHHSRSRTHSHSHRWSRRKRLSTTEFRKLGKPSSKTQLTNGSNVKKRSTLMKQHTSSSTSSLVNGFTVDPSLSKSEACDTGKTSFLSPLLKSNKLFLYGHAESDEHSTLEPNHHHHHHHPHHHDDSKRNSSSSLFTSPPTTQSPCSHLDDNLVPSSAKIENGFRCLKVSDRLTTVNGTHTKDYDNSTNHIRIKLSLTKSGDKTRTLSTTEGSDLSGDNNHSSYPDEDTSVAKRRVIRKCRQMLQNNNIKPNPDNSPSLDAVNMAYDQIVRRCVKRFAARSQNRTRTKLPNGRMVNGVVRSSKNALVHVRVRKSSNHGSSNNHAQSNQDLVYLHSQTVAHVKSTLAPGQNGLNHCEMSGFTEHYAPRDLHSLEEAIKHKDSEGNDPSIGHSEQPVPLALTQYLELTKQAFMDHFAMLRSPEYLSLIKSQVEKEQARQSELWEHARLLEQTIAKLHADGTELLNRFTKRLGILISTPANFFAQARKLIKHHHLLEEKIAESRKQISELSAANQELVRRHRLEAARLLCAASVKPDSRTCTNPLRQPRQPDCDVSTDKPKNHLAHPLFSETAAIPPPPPLTKVSTISSNHVTHYSQPLLVDNQFGPHSNLPLRVSQTLPKPIPSESVDPSCIPPPPPLLPMHNNLPPILHNNSTNSNSSNINSNRQDPSALSSSPDRLSKNSFIKTKINKPNQLYMYPNKSMHSSLQDLIAEEFSRSPSSDSFSKPNESSPRYAHYNSHKNNSSPPNTQPLLPPRKRPWDSSYDEYNVRKSSKHHSKSRNLSPPTLSPVAIEPGSFSYELEAPEHLDFSDKSSESSSNFLGLLPPPPLLVTHEHCSSTDEPFSNQVIPLIVPSQTHNHHHPYHHHH